MTVSIRRMTLGSGYKYLMGSVAQSDGASQHSSALTRYYAESGTPPGRFIGQGLAGLGNGLGIEAGSQVTEEHLFRMLGMVQDPITGEQLGRPPRAQKATYAERVRTRISAEKAGLKGDERDAKMLKIKAEERIAEAKIARAVAGFDLTFSAPKSVSVAWALADGGTQGVIYAAHQQALAYVLRYAEECVFTSRSGKNGVVQEEIRGVVGAAFDQKWSRPGWFVVADTTVFCQADKLEELDLGEILASRHEPVHLLVPMVVVDELDGLKRSNKPKVRWRAQYTLAVLDRVLSGSSTSARLRDKDFSALNTGGIPRGEVTVEIVPDPPGHARLPINDDEIIDRALAIQSLSGRNVTLLTFDTGQNHRARDAGLQVKKLTEPRDEEPA